MTLGLQWSHPVDLWSMGCILAELWTGCLLFSTHDEVEHLALMERTLGALPRSMLRSATCKRADRNFRHGYLRWPERAIDRESEEHVRSQRRLRECLAADPRGEPLPWSTELSDFHDLISRLLEFMPEHRLTAAAAMQHPFIRIARSGDHHSSGGNGSGGGNGNGSSVAASSGGGSNGQSTRSAGAAPATEPPPPAAAPPPSQEPPCPKFDINDTQDSDPTAGD